MPRTRRARGARAEISACRLVPLVLLEALKVIVEDGLLSQQRLDDVRRLQLVNVKKFVTRIARRTGDSAAGAVAVAGTSLMRRAETTEVRRVHRQLPRGQRIRLAAAAAMPMTAMAMVGIGAAAATGPALVVLLKVAQSLIQRGAATRLATGHI